MKVFFLVLGPMGLAPYQSHIFKQASQMRKGANHTPPISPTSQHRGQSSASLPHSLGDPKAIRVLPKHLDEKGIP